MRLRTLLKNCACRLLRKEPEAVVVSFWSGEDHLAQEMVAEVRRLVPDRRHFIVTTEARTFPGAQVVALRAGSAWSLYRQLWRSFRHLRIGLAPVLFGRQRHPLRLAAFLLTPRKILAYNSKLERFHLRASSPLAAWLFRKGLPLDRVRVRPWAAFRSDVWAGHQILEGRPFTTGRRRIGVLAPFPAYPLSHGGAVRMFHLLRESAAEFDLVLFTFRESRDPVDYGPLLSFCSRLVLIDRRQYRGPRRWSRLPPGVSEYRSRTLERMLDTWREEYGLDLMEINYTQLAGYRGDVLVEHDITWDLYSQVWQRAEPGAWWDYRRWRRFEERALRRFPRVVVMSPKDAALAVPARAVTILPNGVDLDRYQPVAESPGARLLMVGSFRHFPNVRAYQFFIGDVWPRVRESVPDASLTVVAGSDHVLAWRRFADSAYPPVPDGVQMFGFVENLAPLYAACNVVLVATPVSAGTNVKVLEAMAMERAVVSTSCGVAGIGLTHGDSAWIADTAQAFAEGIVRLLDRPDERMRMARAARRLALRDYDWAVIGEQQRALYRELLSEPAAAPQAAWGDRLRRMMAFPSWSDRGL